MTFRSLTDQVNASLTQERVVAMLSGFFGALALLLAGLGLYGVTVVRRQPPPDGDSASAWRSAPRRPASFALCLLAVTLLVGIGVIAGAGVSLWASKFVATLLYGLEPRDPSHARRRCARPRRRRRGRRLVPGVPRLSHRSGGSAEGELTSSRSRLYGFGSVRSSTLDQRRKIAWNSRPIPQHIATKGVETG